MASFSPPFLQRSSEILVSNQPENRDFFRKRQIFASLAFAVCAIGVLIIGFYFGGKSGKLASFESTTSPPEPRLFSISGNSMAPTLIGVGQSIQCEHCGEEIIFDATESPSEGKWRCNFCGKRVSDQTIENAKRMTPDIVVARSVKPSELQRGQIVAVEWDGIDRAKRIVGLPGDVITVDQRRLLVNAVRAEDLIVSSGFGSLNKVFVSNDPTRWQVGPMVDDQWQYSDESWSCSGTSSWLVYHHVDIHNDLQPSAVYDDYPFNIGLRRKLNPVDRLVISISSTQPNSATLEVAFWTDEVIRVARKKFESTKQLDKTDFATLMCSWYDAKELESQLDAPVRQTNPIAIRIVEGNVNEISLVVERCIEYRLSKRHDEKLYPIQLGDDEVFVVGDNVPTSIDSRDVGPLKLDSVVGVCEHVAGERSAYRHPAPMPSTIP